MHTREKNAEYRLKALKTKGGGYVGLCICPKCGLTGYKEYTFRFNKNTKKEDSIHTRVRHQHSANNKTVLDKICYIGMGKL